MPKPLKQNWAKGNWQVLIWLRTPSGSILEYDTADANISEDDPAAATAYLAIMCACGDGEKPEISRKAALEAVTQESAVHPRLCAVRDLLAQMSDGEYAHILGRKKRKAVS